MQPERSCTVNGHVIREYYWAGEYPVYLDNRLTKRSYEDAVYLLKAGADVQLVETGDE